MAATTQQQQQQQQQREADKELRGNIRALLSRAKHDKHNLVSVENNRIVEFLQESNQYVEQVTRPRDQADDAQAFNYITEAGLEYVTKLKQGGRNYTAGDLIRRLKAQHVTDTDAQAVGADDPEAFNWVELGQLPAVAVLFRSVPVVYHMLGPMDAAPRQRRQVQRQAKRKAPVGEAVRPEEVEDLQDAEKQETDRNMEEMWLVLRAQGGRVSLLDLVLNHVSFAQTVENLFTLSFLVRDNKVALEENEEEGICVVQRIAGRPDPKDKSRESERMQFVIPLDIDTWELWKKATDASKPPLMKHRKEWRQHAAQPSQQQQEQVPEEQQQQQQQHQQGDQRDEVEQGQEEEEEEDQLGPAQRRRNSRAQRQQQQEQQERDQRQANHPRRRQQRQQAPAVKREPQTAAAAAAGGTLDASDADVTPPHASRQKQQQTQPQSQVLVRQTQTQLSQGTQRGSGARGPKRGKRV